MIVTDDCISCGQCIDVCPAGAIEIKSEGAGYGVAVINTELCCECGVCREICPNDAIE